jgi:hypothetical protein
MIQRIQSVYLILTTFASVLFLPSDFLKFTGKEGVKLIMNFKGVFKISGEQSLEQIGKMIPVSVISVLIPLISISVIFLYKFRKLQIKLTLTIIILEFLLIALITYYWSVYIDGYNAHLLPGFWMLFPFIIIVLSFLAYLGIKKDEILIKSYDRLR